MALSPALLVGIGNILTPGASGGGVGPTTLRAMGQGGYTTIAGFGIGAGNIAQRTRSRHRAQARTSGISVVYALFSNVVANPIQDTLFTVPIDFGAGFEINPLEALTGLAPRTPWTWGGGAIKKSFDPATWDPNVFIIESDELPFGDLFGRYLEKNEIFGCHSGQVLTASGASGNSMPYQRPLTNYLQRWTGRNNGTTDNIGTTGTPGTLFTAASYTTPTAIRGGSAGGLIPMFFKFRVPKTMISMFGIGDSKLQDQKVGYGLNPVLFDVQGDAEGNHSFYGMAAKRLDVMSADVGRGGDGNKYLRDRNNWRGRLQGLMTSGATCIDLLNNANDYTSSSNPTGWAASTVYAKWAVCQSGGNAYIATVAGTSAASGGPTGTGTGSIVDGTATWRFLGVMAGTTGDNAYRVFGWCCEVVDIIRNEFATAGKPLPTIRLSTPDPKGGATTDGYATPENQTVATSNPIRIKLRALYIDATLRNVLPVDDVYSLSTAIETAQDSGVIRTNGLTTYILDPDGIHEVDQGHVEKSLIFPAPPAVTPAQLAGA